LTTAPKEAQTGLEPRPAAFCFTDSGWFWMLLFSLMALVGIALIAPKFDKRQRQIERRFFGREQVAMQRARQAAGLPPIDQTAAHDQGDPRPVAVDAEGAVAVEPQRIVPLWTLSTAAVVAAMVAATMLVRESRGPKAGPDLN